MRAKRSKKYRKLMHQYEMTFGFREPYQVLRKITTPSYQTSEYANDQNSRLELLARG